MALSPTLVDREQGKFRDAGSVTSSRVAVVSEDVAASHSFSVATNTTPTVSNVSGSVLASNTARKYACFTNNSGSIIYIKLGATAVVNQGIPIQPNGKYEINLSNLFTGTVNAIKSGTSTTLDVVEGT